ncbi:MAG: hypothetical protein QM770_24940 [Tepidisphaeraceae bacterium]
MSHEALLKSLLFRTRMYADYGCFEIFDVGRGRFGEDVNYDHNRGFARSNSRIWYSTGGERYDHRLDVWHVDAFVDDPAADRVVAHELEITDIHVGVGAFDMEWCVVAGSGWLTVYMLAYNVGIERPWDAPDVSDDEFLSLMHLSRFEVQLVRGRGIFATEGVIRGSEALRPPGGAT